MSGDLPSNFMPLMTVLQNYTKSPVRILPTTGQGSVKSGGYIQFTLPVGCVLDLRTFHITFWGKTLIGATPFTSTTKLCGFPQWTSSLIDNLSIWVNGREIQNIPNYNYVYKLYQDYKTNYASKLKQQGINADPSVYTHMTDAGAITKWCTYSASANADINAFANNYVIDDFLGFLGTSQPSIIDTNILGEVVIKIRLAPSSVLWTSANIGTDAVDYQLDNICAYCDKLDFKDDRYYTIMNGLLDSQTRLTIPYKNYMVYVGEAITGTNKKTGTIKITESTESLDKIIFSFVNNTAEAIAAKQPLQLGDTGAIVQTAAVAALTAAPDQTNVNAAIAAFNTYLNTNFSNGAYTPKVVFNYTNLLANGDANLLNTSIAFRRNGLGMGATVGTQQTGTVQFQINSQDVTHPLDLLQGYQQTLQAFELNDDDLRAINPAIKDLSAYERDFYACAFSTSHINNKDSSLGYVQSGRDTQATSMNIAVKFTAGRNGDAAQNAFPVIITEMTSKLMVAGLRNVMPIR